jgi:geranylgeranyl reductase family protein
MPAPPRPDVVIAGAGPAGAWAACRLARAGARVTLVDGSHPREKPCGGAVTGRALDALGDSHLFRSSACGKSDCPLQSIDSARFEYEGRCATVPLPAGALVVASRAAFDGALLDAALNAGASLVPARALDVTADERGVSVRTPKGSIRAGWIIGADGATSVVRRRLWRPFRRDEISIASGFFARGVTSGEIVVRFEAAPAGYAWSFPRPDHLAVGICAQADEVRGSAALRAWTAEWIRDARLAVSAALEPYAWPIPSLSEAAIRSERPAGARWMLIGDAAGLVDPITREGIFFALQSAGFAADAILSRADPAAVYVGAVRRHIYPELSGAARLKRRFFRQGFLSQLVAALAESPAIAAVMADLVAGRQPYRGLRRRLLATLELGLAWRLISERRIRPARELARRDA